jgi:hypothetical protein
MSGLVPTTVVQNAASNFAYGPEADVFIVRLFVADKRIRPPIQGPG